MPVAVKSQKRSMARFVGVMPGANVCTAAAVMSAGNVPAVAFTATGE